MFIVDPLRGLHAISPIQWLLRTGFLVSYFYGRLFIIDVTSLTESPFQKYNFSVM